MKLPFELKRPLIFFDLETTGLDFKYDRIIEIGAIKIFPDEKSEVLTLRINPGMRIPQEVTEITGISNKDVENCETFLQALPKVESYFHGSDLAGYNVIQFDAKVLDEEFRRAGVDLMLAERFLVDAKIIFHQKEKRDLTAALKFYCNKDLQDAHSAQADTQATLDIWLSQMERYADLPKDVDGLDKFCKMDTNRFVDSERKFFWRDGEAVFNFGKHRSKSIKWVSENDRNYLAWVISPDRKFAQDVVDICYDAMNGKYPQKRSSKA